MRDLRKVPLRTYTDTHPTYEPIYCAEIDIVDSRAPTVILHTVNCDNRTSEYEAAKEAVQKANAWIAAHRDGTEIKTDDSEE